MWFGIIVQLFMLACMAVLVWYAGEALRVFTRLDASFDKLRAFLDAQDINRRADETQERAEMSPLRELMKGWLPLSYSLLCRLLSTAEDMRALGDELASEGRSTTAAPPPDASKSEDRTSDHDGMTQVHARSAALAEASAPPSIPETTPKPGVSPASRHRPSHSVEMDSKSRRSGYHSPFASASASTLSSTPSQIAAGLGPRPPSSTVAATSPASRAPHLPPVKLTDSTRSATLIGTMRAVTAPPAAADSVPPESEPGNRTSWEPLKRGGMMGASLRPVAEPRFPGTRASMQAVTSGSASPSSGRRAAPVEVKVQCRECDGGFVHVGAGGIGKCDVCAGSGLVAMAAQS